MRVRPPNEDTVMCPDFRGDNVLGLVHCKGSTVWVDAGYAVI